MDLLSLLIHYILMGVPFFPEGNIGTTKACLFEENINLYIIKILKRKLN